MLDTMLDIILFAYGFAYAVVLVRVCTYYITVSNSLYKKYRVEILISLLYKFLNINIYSLG